MLALIVEVIAGDRIAVCMPMTHTSVIIYLGIILAGCAVIGIADSFSPQEIASRLRLSKASLLFTQDVIARGWESPSLYKRATQGSSPIAIVLPASPAQLQVYIHGMLLSCVASQKQDGAFMLRGTGIEDCPKCAMCMLAAINSHLGR